MKRDFACEPDVLTAVEELLSRVRKDFHISGRTEKREAPIQGRGRPRKDEEPEIRTSWKARIEIGPIREEVYERNCRRESTFILVYRLENNPDMKPPREVLKAYKNQNKVSSRASGSSSSRSAWVPSS
jgi:hypothetical protein